MAHSHIYLGRERGKRVVHKVGLTTQTCYARCKNADYLIGMSFEIDFPRNSTIWLNDVENFIIGRFEENFVLEHGREYFRTPKYNWDKIKVFFAEEVSTFLHKNGLQYTIHEGWVAPNTY